MPLPVDIASSRPYRALTLLTPAQGASLISTRRVDSGVLATSPRGFWILTSDARRCYEQGRLAAGARNLDAIRYRLARAVAMGERNWIARYQAAEADIEARRDAAQARLLAAMESLR